MRNRIGNFGFRIADCGFGQQSGCNPQSAFRIPQLHCAPLALALAVVLNVLGLAGLAAAQDGIVMPGMDPNEVASTAPPQTNYGDGNFFSQELGTLLRIRYNTESYGQNNNGTLDIGTMQVANLQDAVAFIDGQVTLSDEQGVGFNVGVGYRWMNYAPYVLESQRINGWSLWADGSSTKAENFFPQVGVSFESLGELWDLRMNGYIPVGKDSQVGDFRPTGVTDFQGNFISAITQATVDTSFFAGEAEVARRLGAERDAWTFAGPYFLANNDDDTVGYRIGLRGYAYPDLLLQIAISHDEIFATNAAFSLVWFVGRTRTDFQPACGLPDRFREPVMRNDYVVLNQSTVNSGVPLTDADGNNIRIVHVDSNKPPGGDGTFEHPLDNLNNIFGNSQAGDIVLAHAESQFMNQAAVLRNNQRFLGEGNNMTFTVASQELGNFTIPESSPGARAKTRPKISSAPGDAVTLADNNEVANFDIDGLNVTGRGIAAPAGGAGNPSIHDLTIKNTTGDGIAFTPMTLTDTTDLDNDNNTTERFVRGSAVINRITFDNIGGDDIDFNSQNADVGAAGVTLQETIVIDSITSTNGNGAGLRLQNTHEAGTATISAYTNGDGTIAGSGGGTLADGVLHFNDISGDLTINTTTIKANTGYALDFVNVEITSGVNIDTFTYDGLAGAAGGLRTQFFDGTLNGTNSTLTNGTLSGVRLENESDGFFNFASTFLIDGVDAGAGEASFKITSSADDFTANVTMNGTIKNDAGRAIEVSNLADSTTQVQFLGAITTSAGGSGINVHDNDDGTVLFGGDVKLTTTTLDGVTLTDNNNADIDFAQLLQITTTTGPGFTATGGGTINASGTTNSIRSAGGQLVKITDMTIASGAGDAVNFSELNRSAAGALTAVQLERNTGGPILLGTVGEAAGVSGVIEGNADDTILIRNSSNVTVSGLRINNGTNTVSGVFVDRSTNPNMLVNLNDLEINGGDIGVEIDGNDLAVGTLNMTVNDNVLNTSRLFGVSIDRADLGSLQFANLLADGDNLLASTAGGVRIRNSNASISFDSATIIREYNGTDFEIEGGTGTISMAGDIRNSNTAPTPNDTTGRSVHIHNVTGGTINFTATNSILDDNEGMLVVDNQGTATINFLGTHDLKTGVNKAVEITNNDGSTISIGQLDITTTTGNGFEATAGGTLSVTGFGNKIVSAGGIGLDIEDMTIGAVDFESVNTTGGTNGVRLVNNATGFITVGDTGNAAGQGGTIATATDAGVHIENTNVNLNGVTVQNAGNAANENAVEITHTNGTTMNVGLNRLTANTATAARDGVVIDGAGGTGTFNVSIQNLTVDVTGDGLIIQNGATIGAGGTNIIDVDTGVGLQLSNITVGTANANFDHVNVSAGTGNGIVLQNILAPGGGQVQIGTVGGAPNTGGSLTTAGDAVLISNVQNVDLRHLQVVSAGGQGLNIDHTAGGTTAMDVTIDDLNLADLSGDGINVAAANANAFTLRLTNSAILNDVVMTGTGTGLFGLLVDSTDVTTTGTETAFTVNFNDSTQNADLVFRNGSNFLAADASALVINSNGAGGKTIDLLIDGVAVANTFRNNSALSSSANFLSQGGSALNATIRGNTFSNSNAAVTTSDFDMSAIGAASSVLLNLGGTPANEKNRATGAGEFNLHNATGGTFDVFDKTNTFPPITPASRNVGTVVPDPAAANFGDAPAAPTPPVVN